MKTSHLRRNKLLAALFVVLAVFVAGSARAVDHATIELQLIWGTDDAQSPDPKHKPVEPAVEKLLSSSKSPFRWKHYFEVNRLPSVEIASDKSKDKIALSTHCELDIKYLGNNRVQVKLYGDGKLQTTERAALPLLLAGDASNDTAWLVLIRMAEPKRASQAPELIGPQEAQVIADQFRAAYAKMGSPRVLLYVNRELVDEKSGLRLSARKEKVETTRTTGSSNDAVTTRSVADNTYRDNGQAAPTLADKQTVRDVERLMGGPLRMAGATLVDQGVAAQLIGDRSLDSLTLVSEQARKDREAVSKIADVAVEVLVSTRKVTVPDFSGSKTYNVPDIQATAIRLRDAKVIGQASAADVMNKAGGAGYAARNFGVEEITQATALELMDDMVAEGK